MSNLTIPMGRAKGQPVTSCSLDDLDWAITAIDAKLNENPGHRFAAADRRWLDEAVEVFNARKAGRAPIDESAQVAPVTAPAPSRALAQTQVPVGAIREAEQATAALATARQLGHLVSPAPAVGNLPAGCSVMVSAVLVDKERETYRLPGSSERGLGKVALDKIAGALGISWDAQLSQRLDDGSHPHYCHCQAVGRVRNFDGSWRTIQDHKQLDLRDGSALIEEIFAREAKKQRDEGERYRGDGGRREIAQKRQHILSLCMTEARLRAVRSLGLRTSYTEADLAKPFVVAQLTFDGHTDDPEAAKYFRERIADSFFGASAALYGAPREVKQLPRLPPPPVDTDGEDRSYGSFDPHVGTSGDHG